MKTQPGIRAGAFTLKKANEARIGEARAAYYPQLNASMVNTRVSAPSSAALAASPVPAPGGSPLALRGRQPEGTIPGVYDLYTGSVGLSQVLYDFGRTSTQVKINALTVESRRTTWLQRRIPWPSTSSRPIITPFKPSATWTRLPGRPPVQLQEHLDQARVLLEIGTKTKFDVTQAEVNVSNARLTLIQAENQVRLTRLTLD